MVDWVPLIGRSGAGRDVLAGGEDTVYYEGTGAAGIQMTA
jgi:hypothetical protein